MRHFTLNQWSDVVRHAAAPLLAGEMQKHLEEGCSICTDRMNLMRTIAGISQRDARYEPPAEHVRVVKAKFLEMRPGRPASRLEAVMKLVFDSALQPAAAGVRGPLPARQLLYKLGDRCIDVRLERDSGGEIFLAGQVLDGSDARASIGVQVVRDDKVLENTTTNEHGEFQFTFPSSDNLKLRFELSKHNVVVVEIPPLKTMLSPVFGL